METMIGTLCQSCAMPMSQDPKGGGTEADGSKSKLYCSYCYENGEFVTPELTMDGMAGMLEPIMASMNIPQEVVEKTKAVLPSLKRWKKD